MSPQTPTFALPHLPHVPAEVPRLHGLPTPPSAAALARISLSHQLLTGWTAACLALVHAEDAVRACRPSSSAHPEPSLLAAALEQHEDRLERLEKLRLELETLQASVYQQIPGWHPRYDSAVFLSEDETAIVRQMIADFETLVPALLALTRCDQLFAAASMQLLCNLQEIRRRSVDRDLVLARNSEIVLVLDLFRLKPGAAANSAGQALEARLAQAAFGRPSASAATAPSRPVKTDDQLASAEALP